MFRGVGRFLEKTVSEHEAMTYLKKKDNGHMLASLPVS